MKFLIMQFSATSCHIIMRIINWLKILIHEFLETGYTCRDTERLPNTWLLMSSAYPVEVSQSNIWVTGPWIHYRFR
jgi:hypothetical protein